MRVLDDESGLGTAQDVYRIRLRSVLAAQDVSVDLLHGVRDLLAVLVLLGQIREDVRIVLVVAQHKEVLLAIELLAIRQKSNRHVIRSDLVIVAPVVPDALDTNAYLAGVVGVGYVIATQRGGVVLDGVLRDVVGNLPAGVILGQALELPVPALVRRGIARDDLRLLLDAIGEQAHGYGGWPQQVIVATVHPSLASLHRHGLGRVGVGDDEAGRRIAGGIDRVGAGAVGPREHVRAFLFHGVGDVLALGVLLGQAREGVRVVIVAAQDDEALLAGNRLPVCPEHDFDEVGANAVLILGVLPRPGDVHVCLSPIQGVSHVGPPVGRRIVVDGVLGHRICDLAALLVHGQALELPCPLVPRAHHPLGELLPVGPQAHGDGLWAQGRVVIRIDPSLGALDGRGLRLMHVGDGEVILRAAGNFGLVAVDGILGDGVGDGLPVLVCHELREGALPVVVLGEIQLDVGRLAVGHKPDGDGVRALAVLIVRVLPDLPDAHVDLAGVVSVRNGEARRCGSADRRLVRVDRVLGEGVGNLLAIRIAIQAVKLPRPGAVFRRLDRLGHDICIRSLALHVHGDRLGSYAITVVVVVPDLRSAEGYGRGLVAVGDGEAVRGITLHLGRIAADRVLGDGVGNGLAVLVLGDVLELPLLVVGRGVVHHLARHFLRAVHELHHDGGRPHAVAVLVVVPDLPHPDGGLLGLPFVGNGEASLRVAGDGRLLVAVGRRHLLHRVGDVGTVRLLLEVSEGVRPARRQADPHGVASRLTVGVELHLNRRRALPVTVAAVLPHLRDAHARLAGIAGVGDGEAVSGVARDAGRIAVKRVLGEGVFDRLSVLVLWQAGKGALPTVARPELQRLLHVATLDAYGDGRGPLALVPGVVPRLRHVDLHGLGHALVGDGEALGSIARDERVPRDLVVAFDRADLPYGVDNLVAALVFGKVVHRARPAAACLEPYVIDCVSVVIRRLRPVGKKVDVHGLRTYAVLVVRVVPLLRDLHRDLLALMRIGNDKAVRSVTLDVGRIARDRVLLDGVGNLLPVRVLRHAREGQFLRVPRGILDLLGRDFLASVHQANRHGFRALAVGVVVVFPYLRHLHVPDGRGTRVGDGEALLRIARDRGRVAVDGDLRDAVGDGRAARVVDCQIGKRDGPGVACVERQRTARLGPVGEELHRHRLGPLAVAVVRIVPLLGDLHHRGVGFYARGRMHVGDVVARDALLVIEHLVLVNGIGDVAACVVLGQVREGPLPAIGSRHLLVVLLDPVGVQAHDDAARARAVEVAYVLPRLAARHGNGLWRAGLARVRDVEATHRGGVALGHLLLEDVLLANGGVILLEPEAPDPVVLGLYGDGRSGDLSLVALVVLVVDVQLHLGRALAVRVVVVLPILGAADAVGDVAVEAEPRVDDVGGELVAAEDVVRLAKHREVARREGLQHRRPREARDGVGANLDEAGDHLGAKVLHL